MEKKIVIVRPIYEVEICGGPSTIEVKRGTMVRVHPATDLYAQGSSYAEVRSWPAGDYPEVVKVRPYVGGRPVNGKLRTLLISDILESL